MSFLARVREGIKTIYARDPAAISTLEITLAYPGRRAIGFHRLAHRLWVRQIPLSPRLISHVAGFLTGTEPVPER